MIRIIYYDINNNIINNYNIYIFNSNNELILKDKTTLGYIFFTPKKYGIYKIIITSDNPHTPSIYYKTFFFHKLSDKILPIHLNNFNSPLIKIKLIDLFYNLSIERGEINLWQNNIKLIS